VAPANVPQILVALVDRAGQLWDAAAATEWLDPEERTASGYSGRVFALASGARVEDATLNANLMAFHYPEPIFR
jgi:hypothetical protein